MAEKKYRLKVVLNDDVRRISLETNVDYEGLLKNLSQIHPAIDFSQHRLTYLDDEEDCITIGSTDGLHGALSCSEEMNQSYLRITILPKASTPSSDVPTSLPSSSTPSPSTKTVEVKQSTPSSYTLPADLEHTKVSSTAPYISPVMTPATARTPIPSMGSSYATSNTTLQPAFTRASSGNSYTA